MALWVTIAQGDSKQPENLTEIETVLLQLYCAFKLNTIKMSIGYLKDCDIVGLLKCKSQRQSWQKNIKSCS